MLLCKRAVATSAGLTNCGTIPRLQVSFTHKSSPMNTTFEQTSTGFNQFKAKYSAPQFYNTCLRIVSRAAMAHVFSTSS